MVAIDERTAAGVSFAPTEEQTELRRLARAFAEREIRPREAECDAEMRHPAELIAQARAICRREPTYIYTVVNNLCAETRHPVDSHNLLHNSLAVA